MTTKCPLFETTKFVVWLTMLTPVVKAWTMTTGLGIERHDKLHWNTPTYESANSNIGGHTGKYPYDLFTNDSMDNTKKTANPGRKTNNSQSAGMTRQTSNTPTSGTTTTPRGREAKLETSTQNMFMPGTPELSEGLDIPEAPSFQTAQERDQPSIISEGIEPEHPGVEDLTDLGAPFAPEELPDRGSYKEVVVEFPACMPVSSFGKSVTETGLDRSEKIFALAGRLRQALQLGEAALRRPIYSSYGKIVSRTERREIFKEEMDVLRELLTNLYHFDNGANQVGFALQKIILVNLNQQLKSRRNEAEEDLITSGEGIPSLPKWGFTGKADEFWSANDFEILGACYRREVENFLAYIAEHHDFAKIRKNRRPEQRVVTSNSISTHLKKSRTRFSHPMANVNSSAFGHPVQNNSSHALKELFGVKRHEDPLGSNVPRGTANFEPRLICESQGEDNSQETVFSNNRAKEAGTQEIQTATTAMMGKGIMVRAEDPGNLSHQVTHEKTRLVPSQGKETQSLAKRSDIVFKQLGSAEIWYYSQSVETRDRIEQDWNTLRAAIGEYYMNRAFLDKQKARANRASYQDAGNGRETPSEYVIRKLELLQFVYNYTDRELINEIMEGAPSFWRSIITPHLFQDLEQLRLSVKFHEDSLLNMGGGENSYQNANRQGSQGQAKENTQRSPYNPFRNVRVNLVGWTKATSNPQFPKDDSNVSPHGTPDEKGARPCRHCGSGKHWDRDCKYARKGEKRARANMVTTAAEDEQAQEDYDNAYYERFSDEEDLNDDADFQKPSQL
ncbi:uncharacterized protein LACBIDRAFT_323267 [Laccaria bicolor S238N-H82]|uniref:Predicted protein n=1 Tax=Laccaria bicolor (strain S238N-H82 / ATCC MYA-4686) TaxID=486041 RepID=B0CZN7_LACBS|nr:uncharacterized protein LACBIDRAFT_323267 [Laccaria bicolor S238N-H82]EDR12182.1 predicted protein [Laccaria bicolor S238N-H82]|eukprot:XP_001876446.1 predicted protein [Laccaria bicolor S238N-H82]